MRVCRGIPVSPGIAIAPVTVVGSSDAVPPYRSITSDQVESEIERFDRAIGAASNEVDRAVQRFEGELDVPSQILESHRDMIRDPILRQQVCEHIEEHRCSAEYAVFRVVRQYLERFAAMESEYISLRSQDLKAIEREIIHTLQGKDAPSLSDLSDDRVVIGHNLTPMETTAMNRSKVKAFAIEVGGRTSHTAIMARALQIPAVVGAQDLVADLTGREIAIVDGYNGVVILDPDESTLEQYRQRAKIAQRHYAQLLREVSFPAETEDGYSIQIAANIELPDEIHTANEWGAEGVGLYRTEFLYDGAIPDEERQFRTYRNALGELEGKYLVIRVLDLGADKVSIDPYGYLEQNPFLGCRSIRLFNENPGLFRTQVRAILRASAFGDIRLMLPMISHIDEVIQLRKMIRDVMAELKKEKVAFNAKLAIGIMVEVPSAALVADELAKEVDFFSIGTNDLIQYCLAVDRVNERVAHLYQPCHPAVLRLIRMILDASRSAGTPVSICGEMCSEPSYAILLMGLGLRSFSVSPIAIPSLKKITRQITMKQATEIASTCLRFNSAEECQAFLNRRVSEWLPTPW